MSSIFSVYLTLGVFFLAGVGLQFFFSLRISKWPGLILPGLSALLSLIYLFSYVSYVGASSLSIFLSLFWIAFLTNIPTLILLAIYFACRQRYRKQDEIKRMNIQDLE